MKKTLLAVALAAATTTAYADVKLSGHVNYVAGDIEDLSGNEGFYVGPGSTTESRFRIVAETDANNLTYGLKQEFGLGDPGRANALNKRVNEVYVKGDFGKLSLGQGSESGDGAVENDYSGTYVLNGDLSSWKLSGNYTFSTTDPSRTERIRYDSPKLGDMLSFALDYQDDDDVTAAAYLGSSAGDLSWKAAIYFESRDAKDSADGGDEVGGSVAVKLSVFTAAFQYASREESEDKITTGDLDYSSVILGYNSGANSIAVDFQTNEDDNDTVEKETIGLTYVHRPAKGVELYAGYRSVDNKKVTMDEDADGFLIGSRIKF